MHSTIKRGLICGIVLLQTSAKTTFAQAFTNFAPQQLRYTFKQLLDTCNYVGLDKNDYHYNELFVNATDKKNTSSEWQDLYAHAFANYCRDINQGYGIANQLSYSEIKMVPGTPDPNLSVRLSTITSEKELLTFISTLEPRPRKYQLIKSALKEEIDHNNIRRINQLKHTLNTLRWVSHFNLNQYIIVNIASATLDYYQHDSLLLSMKIVVGKPSTKTPRFSAYCNQIILYPYWHVPRSIVVNELLPACRKRPSILNIMNIQVIDSRGNVINPSKINWQALSKSNFPYQLRQSTGCDNALGVIKFNLTSPYSVYLHDTNLKSAFSSKERYFSHGCIRIEKPIELANYLLPEAIDSNFLRACIRNQQPITYSLNSPVPVFVLYMTADVTNDSVQFHKDIYDLHL